eukprot:UN11232
MHNYNESNSTNDNNENSSNKYKETEIEMVDNDIDDEIVNEKVGNNNKRNMTYRIKVTSLDDEEEAKRKKNDNDIGEYEPESPPSDGGINQPQPIYVVQSKSTGDD